MYICSSKSIKCNHQTILRRFTISSKPSCMKPQTGLLNIYLNLLQQEEEEGLGDKTTELEACRVEFDTKNALSVLIDVTSATVDLLAKHHLPMSPPPPMRVLAQCRNLDDIEKLMPNISNLDISQKIMLNFLELRFTFVSVCLHN